MTALWVLLLIFGLAAAVGYKLLERAHETKLNRMRTNSERKVRQGDMSEREVEQAISDERFPLPNWTLHSAYALIAIPFVLIFWNGMMFYAEPTFKYHVRTLWGSEIVYSGVTGYRVKGFGRVNNWKIAMTVQATRDGADADNVNSAEDDLSVSAQLGPQTVVFLDQVDAAGTATARFRLPDDDDAFLKLVHDYRSPANFLNTELIPAFKETIQATGSLMSAEEYFSGGRTDFLNEFNQQLDMGIYLVRRIQVRSEDAGTRKRSADASLEVQDNQEDEGKVIFKVEKRRGPDGLPLRKTQNYKNYGVTLVSARVTDMVPNEKFRDRMKAKQEASAQRAVNREQRIQEEEQKYLAIATGEREAAEAQAAAMKEQVRQTTEEETKKRLALIVANREKEQALIDKQTAQITKDRADIDAQRIKVLADADKYEREARIAGDNALQQKMDTEVRIHQVWADALAKRAVPQYVFGAGGSGDGAGTPVGADSEAKTFMQLLTIDAAKRLGYDRAITPVTSE